MRSGGTSPILLCGRETDRDGVGPSYKLPPDLLGGLEGVRAEQADAGRAWDEADGVLVEDDDEGAWSALSAPGTAAFLRGADPEVSLDLARKLLAEST